MQYVAAACAAGTASVACPFLVEDKVLMLAPCTKKVHMLAEKQLSRRKARAIELLQYFAKPADRGVQAAVAPVFKQIAYVEGIIIALQEGRKGYAALAITAAPLMLPAVTLWGVLEAAALLGNGALQLAIPYGAAYSVFKGKESAREYFDFYNHRLNRQGFWLERSPYLARVVKSKASFAYHRPKTRMIELEKILRTTKEEDASIADQTDSSIIKAEQDVGAALFVFQPQVLLPLVREYVHS